MSHILVLVWGLLGVGLLVTVSWLKRGQTPAEKRASAKAGKRFLRLLSVIFVLPLLLWLLYRLVQRGK